MRVDFGTTPSTAIVQQPDNQRSLEREDGCDNENLPSISFPGGQLAEENGTSWRQLRLSYVPALKLPPVVQDSEFRTKGVEHQHPLWRLGLRHDRRQEGQQQPTDQSRPKGSHRVLPARDLSYLERRSNVGGLSPDHVSGRASRRAWPRQV